MQKDQGHIILTVLKNICKLICIALFVRYHHVYFDNYFSSVKLLIGMGFTAVEHSEVIAWDSLQTFDLI